MSAVIAHAPGTFCWMELASPDAEAAKSFYGQIFGWDAHDTPAGPDAVYTFLRRGDKNAAALHQLTDAQREQGSVPAWFSYVATDDVDASAQRARDLGGTVVVEPFDVMDAGRMAIIQDPTGGTFGLWQAGDHIGADVLGQPGALCWSELASRDAAAAEPFYTGLFGWTAQTQEMSAGPYTVFSRGEEPAAGLLQMTDDWGDVPSHWVPYFGVEDCDDTAARARAAGATIIAEPFSIPGVGRIAVLRDPHGVPFSIMTFADAA